MMNHDLVGSSSKNAVAQLLRGNINKRICVIIIQFNKFQIQFKLAWKSL